MHMECPCTWNTHAPVHKEHPCTRSACAHGYGGPECSCTYMKRPCMSWCIRVHGGPVRAHRAEGGPMYMEAKAIGDGT